MARPLVCILGSGDWPETNRAVASARRFGLDVAVGVSGAEQRGTPHADARRYPVEWRDDFADARNQLAERMAASNLAGDDVLWLDSDEELEVFPTAGVAPFAGPSQAVLIRDRADLTPRAIVRLQRRKPLERWIYAIHEKLPSGLGVPRLVDEVLIRHHGYEDAARVDAKYRRNRRIVERETGAGRDYYALALERARAASGGAAFMAWLRAFNHREAAPAVRGAFDGRCEPARAMCEFDYCQPALEVLQSNPRIVNLQLAVLASTYRREGIVDEARFMVVLEHLSKDGNDPLYSYPRVLRGAMRDGVLAWLAAEARLEAS